MFSPTLVFSSFLFFLYMRLTTLHGVSSLSLLILTVLLLKMFIEYLHHETNNILGLHRYRCRPYLLRNLAELGYKEPTPIQRQAMTVLLSV